VLPLDNRDTKMLYLAVLGCFAWLWLALTTCWVLVDAVNAGGDEEAGRRCFPRWYGVGRQTEEL
jgi:hypothetical protein